jgi:hypothetical protein
MRRFSLLAPAAAALALAALALTACPPAAVAPERLRVSAHSAQLEARTRAVTWSEQARLRWVEGEAVAPDGFAYPDRGGWQGVLPDYVGHSPHYFCPSVSRFGGHFLSWEENKDRFLNESTQVRANP